MLQEPASNPQYIPPLPPLEAEDDATEPISTGIDSMRELVMSYMTVAREETPSFSDILTEDQALITRFDSEPIVSFYGYLKQNAEQAYTQLDKELEPYDCYPLLRQNLGSVDAPHVIHIVEGRLLEIKPSDTWRNWLLFALTVISVFFTGAQQAVYSMGLLDGIEQGAMADFFIITLSNIWRGYPYALAILAILIAHEAGHYIMMRRHGLNGTLPFFIPAPVISPFGTFGAAIVLNDVLKNRKVLLDVGAAGPIAGFIVAVPVVIYGLATSTIIPLMPDGMLEGNSLVYLFAKIVALGQIYPTAEQDVLLNQVAFAGWTGLLITTLNMMPLGQLDGGHIMYALFGERARWAFIPVVLVLAGISIFTEQYTWIVFLIILFFVGRFYALPLDAITPLDLPRKAVAAIALAIFVLTFTPLPFYPASNVVGESATMGMALVIALVTLPRWGFWKRVRA